MVVKRGIRAKNKTNYMVVLVENVAICLELWQTNMEEGEKKQPDAQGH